MLLYTAVPIFIFCVGLPISDLLKLNFFSLSVIKDEIFLTLKKGNDIVRVETNGHLNKTENVITISWPKTQKSIYWRQILKEDSEIVSLLDEYRKWKKRN